MARRPRRKPVPAPAPATMRRGHAFTAARARRFAEATVPELRAERPLDPLPGVTSRVAGKATTVATRKDAPSARRAAVVASDKPGQLKERFGCKTKPTKSTGDGASRPFVPWCDRK